jgi:hypothetical protein
MRQDDCEPTQKRGIAMKSERSKTSKVQRIHRLTTILLAGAFVLMASACNKPADEGKRVATQSTSPSIPHNPLKEAYFGEQHLHTLIRSTLTLRAPG